jgi:hypothetical protein
MPVSLFLMSTIAPGMAALLISTTVPVIVLVPEVWAKEEGGLRHRTRRAARGRKRELRVRSLAHGMLPREGKHHPVRTFSRIFYAAPDSC